MTANQRLTLTGAARLILGDAKRLGGGPCW